MRSRWVGTRSAPQAHNSVYLEPLLLCSCFDEFPFPLLGEPLDSPPGASSCIFLPTSDAKLFCF